MTDKLQMAYNKMMLKQALESYVYVIIDIFWNIRASPNETISLRLPTRIETNWSAQPLKLARPLKFSNKES